LSVKLHTSVSTKTQDRIQHTDKYKELKEMTQWKKCRKLFIQKYPARCNSVSKFIIPRLYEAQHVLGDIPPIIKSLKLH